MEPVTPEPTPDAPRDHDREAPVNPFAPPSSYRSAAHDAGSAQDRPARHDEGERPEVAGGPVAGTAGAGSTASDAAAPPAGGQATRPAAADARFAPPGAYPAAPAGHAATPTTASATTASATTVHGPADAPGAGVGPAIAPAAVPGAATPGYGPAAPAEVSTGEDPAVVPGTPVDSWGRPERAPRPRRALGVVWVVPLLLLALVAGAAGGYLGERWLERPRPVDAALPTTSAEGVGELTGVAEVAAQVLPSVVAIEVRAADGEGTGSGFVLREDGYILTNNHVVASGADGGEIVVVFADGGQEPAQIVGRTTAYDLAVIKVERTGLTPLVLGDSDAVVVGDPVVAIGAPLGLQGTVTTGIVSALNRPVSAGQGQDTAFINAIQTDAAINPGNSGGPLVDATGQVIGINSAIAQRPGATQAAGSIGLGFAIGSNQARRTAEQLIETGVATYPVVGVLLDQRYQGEGVQVSTEAQNGVAPVTQDGPADRAGIEPGDIIVAIDGRPVTADEELIVAIRSKAPGDSVTLTVRTGDEERDVRVVLDETQSAAP